MHIIKDKDLDIVHSLIQSDENMNKFWGAVVDTLQLYPNSALPITPKEAGLPPVMCFDTGTVVACDGWEEPKTILGVQGVYKANNICRDRQLDQNSFILCHLNERFLMDSLHCCYRSESQKQSIKSSSHNTWTFETQAGEILTQEVVGESIDVSQESKNTFMFAKQLDGITVIASDCANVYGKSFVKVQRTWIALMPNILFIVDHIIAVEKVKVITHFIANNRDGKLRVHSFPDGRVVLRRGLSAMKLMPSFSLKGYKGAKAVVSLDHGSMHDNDHPEYDQNGQSAGGSSLIFKYSSEDFKREHSFIYAIPMDEETNIKNWHVSQMGQGACYIEPPKESGGCSIKIESDGTVYITNHENNQKYFIKNNKFEQV